ncbi:Prolyl oligopeptidase, N-terminal beta-propeller domain [seawater metagenome]|uniref:Prolyl oligopeptidase, N-terminal beta-propeller domain n=1 Tax=seawater metagenome TaxID=1561972 RepID=A0A5E8CKY9_9ZZZZ
MNTPHAKRVKYNVPFGNVDDNRGQNLIDPPKMVEDHYYWLRDDKRENEEILNHLKKENAYTENVMSKNKEVIESMYADLLSHIKEDDSSLPLPHGEGGWDSKYYYFSKKKKGLSYPIHCRINKESGQEQVILDENILANGKETFDLSSFKITKDHQFMSYGIDETGNEKYQLKIINIDSNTQIEHKIPELSYCSYFWHKNHIYYLLGDEKNRLYQLWKYNLNDHMSIKLFQVDNELIDVSASITEDKSHIFISANSYETDDIYCLLTDDEKMEIKQFTPKIEGHKYSLAYHKGLYFITTNLDDSRNFKIMIADEIGVKTNKWKDFINYSENIYIKGVDVLEKHLLISYSENGNNMVRVIPQKNSNSKHNYYNLSESYNIETNQDIKNIEYIELGIYNTNTILYSENTLKTPYSIYKLNLDNKELECVKVKEVPNFNSNLYEVKRLKAPSHDGVLVPISIIYRKDKFTQNGNNPLYLYGYGSYGCTVDPDFDVKIIPLLDRGFVYAIAHVRGGSFLGYKWYEDGKMFKKKNTFLDFTSCAEYLIKEKYTGEKKITIEGRSAGGLLVGAAMVMKPKLFRTVIAGVPFVDVLNTMSDPSIPLTTQEWEQWGNPNNLESFNYMKEYSPYDNIDVNSYPHILALAGLNDPRVAYWEPAKFVNKLRYYNTNNNLMLLKVEMEEGHFGGMDRYKYLKELAFQYAFVLETYDLEESTISTEMIKELCAY